MCQYTQNVAATHNLIGMRLGTDFRFATWSELSRIIYGLEEMVFTKTRWVATLLLVPLLATGADESMSENRIVFGTYAESNEQLRHVCLLVESIREFGGRFADALVLIYLPREFEQRDADLVEKLQAASATIRECSIPEHCAWFYYAGKTFAAGLAEAEAADTADILVWLDEDTIILTEPEDLLLSADIGFAYRPVMHNRSGSLYREPPSPFWAQIYETLAVDPESLFPMTTPADRQQIRAYFNAGLLVVRPELGILRGWGDSFAGLCQDPVLLRMCQEDVEKRIFLHQTALVGAAFTQLGKERMTELSERYNYPIFFKQQFGAVEEFDDISNIVTLRYDTYFRDLDPDWADKLRGPADKIGWLKDRLERE